MKEKGNIVRNFWEKILKWIWIPIISMLIGICGEMVYNLPFDKQSDYQYIEMENVDTNGFELVDGNTYRSSGDAATLTLNFEKQYVDKFTYAFDYDKTRAFACEIVVKTYPDGENSSETIIYDTNNYTLSKSTVNVRLVTDQIQIRTYAGSSPVTISKIAINNTGNYSEFRILFIAIVVFFILTMCSCWKNKIVIPLEIAFLVITIVVGGLSVAALPSHKVGFDEEIHFGRSYFWGETIQGKETISYPHGIEELYTTSLSNWPMDLPQSEQERKEENEYRNAAVQYNLKEAPEGYWREDANYALSISSVAYVFQYLFIKIGMVLKLPFIYVYKLGRMSNVLLYAILGFFAIRHLKAGKRIFFLFALMPTAMMAAITYTYDAWVNGFSFLAMSYLLGMWFDKQEKIKWKDYIIMLAAFIFASMPKAIYIPFVLLAVLIPSDRFRNKKEMYIMKGIVCAAFLIMLSSFVWPTVSNPQAEGDSRGGDTSVAGQLIYIFSHPWCYTKLLLSSIGKSFYSYTIGTEGLARMGHFTNLANTSLIGLALAYTVGTDCRLEERVEIKLWQKVSILAVCFGVMCLIWTALYLSFTPVGLNQINGVQGRYYIPITIWILWTLRNQKVINQMEKARDYVVVETLSLAILLPIIYTSIISATF